MKKANLIIGLISIMALLMLSVSCTNCETNNTTKDVVEEETIIDSEVNEEDSEYVHEYMVITKLADTETAETPHKVDVRKLYDKSSAQVMHITLQPGEALKPHITPVDAIFYILEGTADIMVGDETKTVETDCLVESPKDIKHCIYNNSDQVLRVLVIKAPKQTTSTTLL